MRTELNIGMTEGPPDPRIAGDPLQPANPGFRATCETQCFCSRAGPELRERLRDYLAATPERHSVLRGSVRPKFREAPVSPGTWWYDEDSDDEMDADYPLF